jgi:hypothetical protein
MAKNLSHPGSAGPARDVATVTPTDASDLPEGLCRSLFVGVAGAVRIRTLDGNEATLISGESQYHPIQIIRVLATGTTATEIVALY